MRFAAKPGKPVSPKASLCLPRPVERSVREASADASQNLVRASAGCSAGGAGRCSFKSAAGALLTRIGRPEAILGRCFAARRGPGVSGRPAAQPDAVRFPVLFSKGWRWSLRQGGAQPPAHARVRYAAGFWLLSGRWWRCCWVAGGRGHARLGLPVPVAGVSELMAGLLFFLPVAGRAV